jgi:hypothetical protein
VNFLRTTLTVCGAAAVFAAITPFCSAHTYYVDVNGNDGNSGTLSSPVATLDQAVYKVSQDYASGAPSGGDTININGNGEHYHLNWAGGGNTPQGYPTTINTNAPSNAPIIIQTTPGQSAAILDGGWALGAGGGNWQGTDDNIDINGTYITVQNLTIENASVGNIVIPNGSYDTINNCTIAGAGWVGAQIGSTASTHQLQHDAILNSTIHDNNEINTNGNGPNWAGSLVLSNCTNCNLQYNIVYHNWGEGLGMYTFGQTTAYNYVDDNTVYDNWSVNIYIADSSYNYIWNNLVYSDSNAILRPLANGISFPAIGIASDNENPNVIAYGSEIFNNIVIGGQSAFRAANQNTVSGFYPGGLNGYNIYNNVFFDTSPQNTPSVNPACIQVDNDPNNNFTWENNIVWETNGLASVATDGGGGTQVKATNIWDGTGGFNMNGSSDILLWNSNPGFVSAGSFSAPSYALATTSPYLNRGTNAYSILTFDYNWNARSSSGAWNLGAWANP